MAKLPGLRRTMTAAEINVILAAHQPVFLDLRGVTVNCEATVLVPTSVRKWIGGRFMRAAGLTTSDWMAVVGAADMGTANTRFNALSPVTIGAATEGASELTHGAALAPGWYMAYGDSSSGDASTHRSDGTVLYFSAELVRITGYSGGKLQLADNLTRTYTTLKLCVWEPIPRLVIEDVYFDGYNGAAAGVGSCLVVGPAVGLTVKHSAFRGFTSSGLKICCARSTSVVGCNTKTDSGTGRYHLEFGRCTGVYVANCYAEGGRWHVTGQGTRHGVMRNCYGENGTDAMDHGCNGKYIWVENFQKKPGGGAVNAGNSSFLVGTKEVTFKNCDIRSATPASVDEPVYVYPNSSVRFDGCTLHQMKSLTYPAGLSGLVGDQGPTSITIGAGTTVERGTYGTHATVTGPGGGAVIQFLYNDVAEGAGSKLGTFTLESGAHIKCCTFGAPIRAEGLAGATTFNLSGGLWTQWVNASVPCMIVNSGNHVINLSTGFVMGNTQTTQPSATYDAVRVNAGVTGCTINRGSNAVSKWNAGASEATLTPLPADRVNDVSGLATVV